MAGVRATIHQLRPSFATELVNQGVRLEAGRKLLGHQNMQTTLGYAEGNEMTGKMKLLRNPFWGLIGVVTAGWGMMMPACLCAEEAKSPQEGWDFKFQDFLISAWWSPDFSDAEFQVYAEAGFNVIHIGRYYELDDHGQPKQEPHALDLAQKHGLKVLWDTYTWNETPWGHQVDPSVFPEVPPNFAAHHFATPAKFRWLVEHLGPHPALIGFLLADDVGTLPAEVVENTHYLREQAPQLIPWVCQNWSDPQSLAQAGNPICCVQTYPTLYERGSSATGQMLSYCHSMANWWEAKRRHGLLMWPIFDVSGDCSDSLARFQVYAAIAYGADGIWYFTYNGGGIMRLPNEDQGEPSPAQTVEQVQQRLKLNYGPVAEINWRLRAWGPKLLGRDPAGVFSTGFNNPDWPFPEEQDLPGGPKPPPPPTS